MNFRRAFFPLVSLLPFALVPVANTAGHIDSIYFKTTAPPPAVVFPGDWKAQESMFRLGLQTLPENVLVTQVLNFGGGALGLSSEDSTNLSALLDTTYSRIQNDPAFADVPSALPFCYSAQRQTNGHYFVYRPDHLGPEPLLVVFLHGYGGNFQFYLWALKTSLPDAVIVCPSWNVSWYGGSPQYLSEALRDVRSRFSVKTSNQWLMGISAGGRAGFVIYPQVASDFRGYISLASAPETAAIGHLKKNSRILMINGTTDPMVPIAFAREQAQLARRQVLSLKFEELDADHFFLLSQRTNTFQIVRQFIEQTQPAKP
jgi:pimeloyl-ACP methyl ester carboxylesterase